LGRFGILFDLRKLFDKDIEDLELVDGHPLAALRGGYPGNMSEVRIDNIPGSHRQGHPSRPERGDGVSHRGKCGA
jgi:hypothetical protein